MVALGDFNAKSSNWGSKDITSDKGRKIETGIQQNVLHQEINELTHILYMFSNIDVDKMVPIFNQTINIPCYQMKKISLDEQGNHKIDS